MSFFYDLNKKLDGIRATPEVTHKQLNERDMSRAAKGIEKYGKDGMQALAKAGREGKDLDKIRDKYNKYDDKSVDEGVMDTVKSVGKKVAGGINKLVGHGSDEDMIKDLQRRSGAPVTGKKPTPPQQVKEKLSPEKQKSFAALAPPKDKITFADKIAGAKKEVDEMLGDVAAEAMRKALGGGKGRDAEMDESSEENAFTAHKRPSPVQPKVGSTERGHKHDIKHTATGRVVTRRTDDQGISVGADDEADADGAPRGRGRPKGTKNVSSKAKGPSGKSKLMTKEGEVSTGNLQQMYNQLVVLKSHVQDPDGQASLKELISMVKHYMNQGGGQELDEKAVSKKQQKFMGMVHATQKGEKAPSKEVAKVAKTMKKKDAEDFASTKHKGLPEKVKSKKKKEEEVEESSTTSGAVAASTATTSSKGGVYGKGIYDSMNRELEKMISESMSVNMSDSTEGNKSLTVTATDDDAMKLAMILKSAGLGGQSSDMHSHDEEPCETCGSMDCGCGDVQEAVDENAPDWPTNTETSDDALQYAGGLNKPKTDVAGDGQTTIPNTAVHTQDEDALRRMMEMAGIKQAELEPWKETMKEEGVAEEWAPMKTSAVGKKDSLIAGDFDKWLTNASDRDIMDYVHDEEGGGMPTHHTTTRWQELKKRQTDLLGGPAAAREKEINDRLKSKLKKYPNITAPMKEEEEVEEDFLESIQRMREIAGIQEAKKTVDEEKTEEGNLFTKGLEDDDVKIGDKIPGTNAIKKKDIDESIFALTNQWQAYKG